MPRIFSTSLDHNEKKGKHSFTAATVKRMKQRRSRKKSTSSDSDPKSTHSSSPSANSTSFIGHELLEWQGEVKSLISPVRAESPANDSSLNFGSKSNLGSITESHAVNRALAIDTRTFDTKEALLISSKIRKDQEAFLGVLVARGITPSFFATTTASEATGSQIVVKSTPGSDLEAMVKEKTVRLSQVSFAVKASKFGSNSFHVPKGMNNKWSWKLLLGMSKNALQIVPSLQEDASHAVSSY